MRIILHLIALLSFIALPLAESQTLTPSPSPAASATPHKRVRKSKTVAPVVAATPTESATPTAATASTPKAKTTTEPVASGQVWVNTKTGVYHYPGTRWYGNTNSGKYMSEQDAIKEGDRPAKNGQ
jgi:hypothetical protein